MRNFLLSIAQLQIDEKEKENSVAIFVVYFKGVYMMQNLVFIIFVYDRCVKCIWKGLPPFTMHYPKKFQFLCSFFSYFFLKRMSLEISHL
jgi:hypothetical protein